MNHTTNNGTITNLGTVEAPLAARTSHPSTAAPEEVAYAAACLKEAQDRLVRLVGLVVLECNLTDRKLAEFRQEADGLAMNIGGASAALSQIPGERELAS